MTFISWNRSKSCVLLGIIEERVVNDNLTYYLFAIHIMGQERM